MYKYSLLLAIAAYSLSSCGEDVTYKQKYIELLESHILELQGEEKYPELSVPVEISEDQVRRQAEEFYLFLCGDMNNLLDLRLTEKEFNARNKCNKIVTIDGVDYELKEVVK